MAWYHLLWRRSNATVFSASLVRVYVELFKQRACYSSPNHIHWDWNKASVSIFCSDRTKQSWLAATLLTLIVPWQNLTMRVNMLWIKKNIADVSIIVWHYTVFHNNIYTYPKDEWCLKHKNQHYCSNGCHAFFFERSFAWSVQLPQKLLLYIP